MIMETIIQKLNYKRERSSYTFDWKLACDERGENFLFDYSKLTKHNLVSSGPMFCKTGCFQGQEKYFEFFCVTKGKMIEIFLKMVHPAKEQKMCGETFEIIFASVNTNARFYNYKGLNEFNHALFVLSNAPEDFTDTENASKSTVTWMKGAFTENSSLPMSSVNCLNFSIQVQQNMWGPNCVSSHHQSDTEFTIDESKFNCTGELNKIPFLFSSTFSDVTVYCAGKNYPAHKLILASKSSVLAAMFTHPMQESTRGELKIDDASPEVVEELLRFIYTGSVKNLEQNAAGLSMIAEKYDLPGLKALSLNYLVRTISIENVVERYSLGKLLNSEGMVKKCIATMKTDKKRIWKTEKEFSEVCKELPELFDMLFV